MKWVNATVWGSLLLTALIAPATAAENPPVASPLSPARKAPTDIAPEQVAAWVRELDADEFAKRELATMGLIQAGEPAIAGIAALDLPSQNLEVVTRGLHVLQELALSDDRAVEDAAREVLEKLAQSTNFTAARRASGTLATLNQLRQGRAMEELQKLGVKIQVVNRQLGLLLVHETVAVEIDETFRGESKDLKRLAFLPDVQLVELQGTHINDDVLKFVATMPSMRYLKIKRAKVTPAGLTELTKAAQLEHLSVLYCPIDDTAVEPLAKLAKVKEQRIFGTDMTRDGSLKLREALTNVGSSLDFRQGGFLGIGCDDSRGRCEISQVQKDTAAEKAGLQYGDIILDFGGENVTTFKDLTALIGKYKAGDAVKFGILRDTERLKVEVTLGEWE